MFDKYNFVFTKIAPDTVCKWRGNNNSRCRDVFIGFVGEVDTSLITLYATSRSQFVPTVSGVRALLIEYIIS